MKKGHISTKLTTAKMSAYQAILVALVTAIGGVVTGAIMQRSSHPIPIPRQRWLSIEEIRVAPLTQAFFEGARFRITATVDKTQFSFPTKTLWATIGAHTSAFPLPLTHDHTLSFGIFVLLRSDPAEHGIVLEAASHRMEKISGSEVPVDKRAYPLTLRGIPHTYGGDADVVIVYSIR